MKKPALVSLFLLLSAISFAASGKTYDSLRVEIRNGQKVIVHQVEAKETLFALSRRYQVSVDQINDINPQLVDGLKIGQEVVIPIVQKNSQPVETKGRTHFVDIGETLFSISREYGVEVSDIQVWNNLESTDLSVGQEIIISAPKKSPSVTNSTIKITNDANVGSYHIVAQKETLFAVSQKYGLTIDQLKQLNNLTSNEISIGQKLVIKENITDVPDEVIIDTAIPETTVVKVNIDTNLIEQPKEIIPIQANDVNQFNTRTIKEGELEKVIEEGLAMVIENTTDTKKYLALHRTAEIGTVMQVINMANNLNIYVRVVGRLPNTGENSRILIKMSRTAYRKLRAVDNQFPVQIIYIP